MTRAWASYRPETPQEVIANISFFGICKRNKKGHCLPKGTPAEPSAGPPAEAPSAEPVVPDVVKPVKDAKPKGGAGTGQKRDARTLPVVGEDKAPADKKREAADLEDVNSKLDRYADRFRRSGQHEVAGWMDMLRDHVNAVGVDAALDSLGGKVAGKGDKAGVHYGGAIEMGDFAKQYLNRVGISTLGLGGFLPQDSRRIVSSLAPSAEAIGSRGRKGDVHASLQGLKDKLDEAQHLPGLEKSEDLSKLMGGKAGAEVSHFTPEVVKKLDETYGKDQWIVKPYDDDAYAGKGIYFPQKVAQMQQDARQAVWDSGVGLARHGFEHLRDASGKVVGIKHRGGDEYRFDTARYNDVIHGDARKHADHAAAHAENEQQPALDKGREGNPMRYMAQPAFPVVGISNEERAAGVTFKRGQEGRVHITTRDGKAEVVPHSTWLKQEHLPVVFENDDTRAMAKAAVDAINALPKSQGQVYAPDIVKTRDGYKVVEANPANEAGASGYLADNQFIVDSYVSHVTGREPAHVAFVRKLLTKRNRTENMSNLERLLGNARWEPYAPRTPAEMTDNAWSDEARRASLAARQASSEARKATFDLMKHQRSSLSIHAIRNFRSRARQADQWSQRAEALLKMPDEEAHEIHGDNFGKYLASVHVMAGNAHEAAAHLHESHRNSPAHVEAAKRHREAEMLHKDAAEMHKE